MVHYFKDSNKSEFLWAVSTHSQPLALTQYQFSARCPAWRPNRNGRTKWCTNKFDDLYLQNSDCHHSRHLNDLRLAKHVKFFIVTKHSILFLLFLQGKHIQRWDGNWRICWWGKKVAKSVLVTHTHTQTHTDTHRHTRTRTHTHTHTHTHTMTRQQ